MAETGTFSRCPDRPPKDEAPGNLLAHCRAIAARTGNSCACCQLSGAFRHGQKKQADHIARVSISGVITNDKPMLDLLERSKGKRPGKRP